MRGGKHENEYLRNDPDFTVDVAFIKCKAMNTKYCPRHIEETTPYQL